MIFVSDMNPGHWNKKWFLDPTRTNILAILLVMDDFEMKLDIFDLKQIIFFQNFGHFSR